MRKLIGVYAFSALLFIFALSNAFSQDGPMASQWDEMNSLDQVKFLKSFLATQGDTDGSLLERKIPEIGNCLDSKVRNDRYKDLPLMTAAMACYNGE